jgi:hypothetical protein
MAARVNKSMLELLGGDPEFHEPNAEPVPDSLIRDLMEGFKEVDGCVVSCSYREQFAWSETQQKANNLDDETSLECSLSKVHLDAFVDAAIPLSELARIGCAYAMYLRKALLSSPVSGTFRVIVAAQLPDPELEVGNVCTVRFHKVRSGQAWLVDDIESYKTEALWVLDFDTAR